MADVTFIIVGGSPITLIFASILSVPGFRFAFSDLDFISTSSVDLTQNVKTRIQRWCHNFE